MKQGINPMVAGVVVVLVILVVAVFLIRAWSGPTASAAQDQRPPGARMSEKYDGAPGPSPDQMRQIQEWKRQHPGAATRF